MPVIAICGGASGSITKFHAPSVADPWRSVTAPLAPTGNSADAIPGAASASTVDAPPDTVSLRSNRSGGP